MYAVNLDYQYDILPRESSAYRVPEDLKARLRNVHSGLTISWVSVCNHCGWERPGDMSYCPGQRYKSSQFGHPKLVPHDPKTHPQSIGGHWGIYISHPMREALRLNGSRITVIENRPMYIGYLPADHVAESIFEFCAVTYPPENRMQGVFETQSRINAISRRNMEQGAQNWADVDAQNRHNKQRVIHAKTGMPVDTVMTVPENYANIKH